MSDKKKKIDLHPSLDDYRAPWETAGGEDAEINKGTLKKFIWNLLGDKARLSDEVAERDEKIKTTEGERDNFKRLSEGGDTEKDKALADANAKVADLQVENSGLVRTNVGLSKGLTEAQTRRLVGETREDLEADADAFREEAGLGEYNPNGDQGDGGDDADLGLRRQPIGRRITNPGGRGDDAGPLDLEKALAQVPRPGGFIGL